MRGCIPSYSQAHLRHRARPARPSSASPRPFSIIPAAVAKSVGSCAKRRSAAFFKGATDSHGTFVRDCSGPACSPRCASGMHGVRSRGSARAFARGLLILSQKQTAHYFLDYLALQRVCPVFQLYDGSNASRNVRWHGLCATHRMVQYATSRHT